MDSVLRSGALPKVELRRAVSGAGRRLVTTGRGLAVSFSRRSSGISSRKREGVQNSVRP
ncbi:MAG: hypothetical protein ACLUFV_13680 [Acutalibacteraceae bacterium]